MIRTGKWNLDIGKKKPISKFHFPVKLYEIGKSVIIKNCLLLLELLIETII